MNNAGQILLTLLLLLMLSLSGYWFYKNFSWVNEREKVGFQGIAKTNQLLAAEFFLRKMGVKVQQINALIALRDLPPVDYSLLISTQRETINKDLSQHLLDWVKSGGHLIIEAKYLYGKALKKTQEKQQLLDDDLLRDWSLFSRKNSAKKSNKDIPVKVLLDYSLSRDRQAAQQSIEVNFPYDMSLSQSLNTQQQSWLIKDDSGRYLLQFSLGEGLLTVLTSSNIFYNKQIADYDHAQFLHYLVQLSRHDAGVWLVRVDDMPPLWQWLWSNAWYLMVSLSLLFLLWLWRAPLRLGPVLADRPLARRSLLEHIRASAYYRWHNKQSAFLLMQVQQQLWQRIKKNYPDIDKHKAEQQYSILADISGMDSALIKDALLTVEHINEAEFTRKIQLLELINQQI